MKPRTSHAADKSGTEGVHGRADIIRAILDGSGDGMPKKYQNPQLEVRRDVKRPYYFVRVSVPVITEAGRRYSASGGIWGFWIRSH
jgi:hypothetical protein